MTELILGTSAERIKLLKTGMYYKDIERLFVKYNGFIIVFSVLFAE